MNNFDNIIEKALEKAKYVPEGETAIIGRDLFNGLILRIEYHTEGKTNICDNYREVTQEHWDWEKAGCSNNEEWHKYLDRQLWKEYCAGLKRY